MFFSGHANQNFELKLIVHLWHSLTKLAYLKDASMILTSNSDNQTIHGLSNEIINMDLNIGLQNGVSKFYV